MNPFQTAAIGKYETALQFSLTYPPSGDADWDQRIQKNLQGADAEIRELGLERAPEYVTAVQRAERMACDMRERIMRQSHGPNGNR